MCDNCKLIRKLKTKIESQIIKAFHDIYFIVQFIKSYMGSMKSCVLMCLNVETKVWIINSRKHSFLMQF